MLKKTVSLKLYLVTIIFFFAVIAMLMMVILYKQTAQTESIRTITISTKDNLRELSIVNTTSNDTGDFLPNNVNVLIYLSSSCQACKLFIDNLPMITSVFADVVSFQLLWDDTIPESDDLERIGIPLSYNFSCQKSVKLSTTTPTFYITDSSGIVTFITTDVEMLIKKLVDMNLLAKSEMQQKAFSYIALNYSATDNNVPHLIYFAMDGCSDCHNADKMISDESLEEKYNIVRIYTSNDSNPSRIKDTYDCFKTIFDIKWFPTFALIENDTIRIIGEMPIDDLRTILTKA